MQWILCIYLLQFLCLYVYCNLVKIFRGGSRKFRGELSSPEGPEKTLCGTMGRAYISHY